MVAGSKLFFIASIIFNIPAMPAEVSKWPKFDFAVPIEKWMSLSAKNCSIEWISVSSPKDVPVAWHSM